MWLSLADISEFHGRLANQKSVLIQRGQRNVSLTVNPARPILSSIFLLTPKKKLFICAGLTTLGSYASHWYLNRYRSIKISGEGVLYLNGTVERSGGTDQHKLYQLLNHTDDVERHAKPAEWKAFYNYHRPHGSLEGTPSQERLIETYNKIFEAAKVVFSTGNPTLGPRPPICGRCISCLAQTTSRDFQHASPRKLLGQCGDGAFLSESEDRVGAATSTTPITTRRGVTSFNASPASIAPCACTQLWAIYRPLPTRQNQRQKT